MTCRSWRGFAGVSIDKGLLVDAAKAFKMTYIEGISKSLTGSDPRAAIVLSVSPKARKSPK
jgi:hypothetical protein